MWPAFLSRMNLWMIRLIGFLIGAGLSIVAVNAPAQAQWPFGAPPPLSEIEDRLANRHDTIEHITVDTLAAMQTGDERFILLDVRERREYDVSHIPGAMHVDPGANASDVKGLLTGARADTPIVVYCTVGRRSSRLGSRIETALAGRKISNLRGGILAWHNAGKPLENAAGTTDAVHPYNKRREKLLVRSDTITYAPIRP